MIVVALCLEVPGLHKLDLRIPVIFERLLEIFHPLEEGILVLTRLCFGHELAVN